MLESPSYVAAVLEPVIAPIRAHPGELLVIWPGHETHTITVLDQSGARELRHCFVSVGALYGQMLMLAADGVIDLRMLDGRTVSQRRAS